MMMIAFWHWFQQMFIFKRLVSHFRIVRTTDLGHTSFQWYPQRQFWKFRQEDNQNKQIIYYDIFLSRLNQAVCQGHNTSVQFCFCLFVLFFEGARLSESLQFWPEMSFFLISLMGWGCCCKCPFPLSLLLLFVVAVYFKITSSSMSYKATHCSVCGVFFFFLHSVDFVGTYPQKTWVVQRHACNPNT